MSRSHKTAGAAIRKIAAFEEKQKQFLSLHVTAASSLNRAPKHKHGKDPSKHDPINVSTFFIIRLKLELRLKFSF